MKDSQILLIDKPAGWTSFDVVAKIRGQIRAKYLDKGEKPTKKQLKVGHSGTLDPFATGLLIILAGDACKLANEFIKLGKTYEFTAELGKSSTTGDPEGEVKRVSEYIPSIEEITSVLQKFTGQIKQKPPAYSAIKIDGKRAYKLAREGKEIYIPSRLVTITRLEIINYEYPRLKCVCDVSSGTYIRSLVQDIGSSLKTGAYCTQLRRTRIGKYSVEDSTRDHDI